MSKERSEGGIDNKRTAEILTNFLDDKKHELEEKRREIRERISKWEQAGKPSEGTSAFPERVKAEALMQELSAIGNQDYVGLFRWMKESQILCETSIITPEERQMIAGALIEKGFQSINDVEAFDEKNPDNHARWIIASCIVDLSEGCKVSGHNFRFMNNWEETFKQ